MALGPNHDTAPVCLSCLRPVSGDFLCPACGLPLCGPVCADGDHGELECKIFSNNKKKIQIDTFDGSYHPFYQSIAALRSRLENVKEDKI